MSKEDGLSTFTKHGTGHILQDLLSSTVRLQRSNFVPKRPEEENNVSCEMEENNSSPEVFKPCSICSESTNLRPLALQEMEILAKFVLSQEQISLILQIEDHPPIFCCKICSSAILSLAKLTTQIENITISLRAVISSRNGHFNKTQNEAAKISEFSREDEEFTVKIQPTFHHDEEEARHEITSDPLYEPESDSNSNCDLANSDVHPESKYVCKICQPNVNFATRATHRRHMRNKNIHPEISDAVPATIRTEKLAPPKRKLYPCPKCDKSFATEWILARHNRTVHELTPVPRKCTFCPEVFTNLKFMETHMQLRHNVPIPTQKVRHTCAICSKTLANLSGKQIHVEQVHFRDRTSCPYGCKTKFDSEAEWVTHLEGCDSPKMSAESDCVCKYCRAVFRNFLLQIEHILRVHPETTYTCSACQQSFTRQPLLYSHRCINPTKTARTASVTNSGSEDDDAELEFVSSTISVTSDVHETIQPDISAEFCNEVAPDFESPAHIISNKYDAPQLTGSLEEEFPLKIEPTSDDEDEITSDPLRDPERHEFNVPNSLKAPLASSKFECNLCNAKFSKSSNLLRHMSNKNIHPGISTDNSAASKRTERRPVVPLKPRNPFPCPKCDRSFTSKWGLHQHRRLAHDRVTLRRKCAFCPIVFVRLSILEQHMAKYHNVPISSRQEEGQLHSCAICAKIFATPASKRRHVEMFHFRDKTSCPYGCKTKIDSDAAWVTHLEGCDSPKMRAESQRACPYCPAVFRNLLLQIEHCLRVHPQNTYSCSTCGQRFTGKFVHDMHRCTTNSTNSQSKPGAKYVCKICQPNVTFASSVTHRRHMRNKNIHPTSTHANFPRIPLRKFACKICKRKFSRNCHLLRHLSNKNIHPDISASNFSHGKDPLSSKKFACKICNKKFTRKCHLLRHHGDIHDSAPSEGRQLFVPPKQDAIPSHEGRHCCAICAKTFATSAIKDRHVELVHFRDKTSCPYGCQTKIDSEAGWVSHLEGQCDSSKMSAESASGCPYCPAVFRSPLLQMEHRLRAHPQNANSCPTCGQRFTSKSVLDQHRCVTNSAKFVCKMCQPNVPFTLRINLMRHVRNSNIHPDISEADISQLSQEVEASPGDNISANDDDQQLTGCLMEEEEEEFPVKIEPTCYEITSDPLHDPERDDALNFTSSQPDVLFPEFSASPADKITNNDDAQQLTGCVKEVEEEFALKIEPSYDEDDDITSDPLYEPESDSDSDSDHAANSDMETESKFVCKICQPNVTFASSVTHRRHMRNKNIHPDVSDPNFSRLQAALASKKKCKLCGKKFAGNDELRRHLRNKNSHPGSSDAEILAASKGTGRFVPQKQNALFPCPSCDKRFFSKTSLDQHQRHVHEWVNTFRRKCTLCPKVFAASHILQTHMTKRHNVPSSRQKERRHSCDMCLKTFTTSWNRNNHVELFHFPDKTSCPYGCETKIDSEAEWVMHLEGECDSPKMSAESACGCQYCPAVFRNVLLQLEHRLRVHPQNTYSCSTCGQRFTRKAALDQHDCTIIGNTTEKKVTKSKPESKYVCKICQPNVSFTLRINHMRHMRNKNIHPDISQAYVAGVQARLQAQEKKFACKLCGIKFSHSQHLYRHMRNKNIHPDASPRTKISAGFVRKTRRDPPNPRNPFPCPKCDQSFASSVTLQHHMRQIHGGIQRKCPHCPRQFTRLILLQRHLQQWHNAPIPTQAKVRYPCDMCSKTFANKYGFLMHVELVHLPDKTSCPYGCVTKIDSEADWVTHLEGCDSPKMNAESEYVCHFCDAVFRNTLLRLEHHLRQHPDNSCFCSFCGGGFTSKITLRVHVNSCKINNSK